MVARPRGHPKAVAGRSPEPQGEQGHGHGPQGPPAAAWHGPPTAVARPQTADSGASRTPGCGGAATERPPTTEAAAARYAPCAIQPRAADSAPKPKPRGGSGHGGPGFGEEQAGTGPGGCRRRRNDEVPRAGRGRR
ncbi:translation initiation factor IF-2-like [Panicum virgatum]|uniref:translation initiation factor IF-2-like n=1 Tax=Panicum virgatum TaxID=38727 RepID=UPI0019D6A14D|nr:translation initiation factor IF-2-like [Panicum virgatum]